MTDYKRISRAELAEMKARYRDGISLLPTQERLIAENERLRTALSRYADRANWYSTEDIEYFPNASRDTFQGEEDHHNHGYEPAREALADEPLEKTT